MTCISLYTLEIYSKDSTSYTYIEQLESCITIDQLNSKYLLLKKQTDSNSKELQIVYKTLYALLENKLGNNSKENINKIFEELTSELNTIENNELKIWQNTQIGYYYYSYNQYEKSSYYFLKNINLIEKADTSLIYDVENVLKMNAYFVYTIKEYDLCINYLKDALQYTSKESENYDSFLNHIGNCYYHLQDYDQALDYLNQAKVNSLENQHTVRYAKVIGDIALIYMKHQRFAEAEKFLLEDISLSKKHEETKNLNFAKIRLGKMYIEEKKFAQAKQILLEVKSALKNDTLMNSFNLEAHQLLLKIALEENDASDELYHRRLIDSLQPIVDITEGKYALQQIYNNRLAEKQNHLLEEKENRVHKKNMYLWLVGCLSVVGLALISILLYNSKKRIHQQKKYYDDLIRKYHLDKQNSEKKLEKTSKTIESFKTYLSEKYIQIEQLEIEIEKLKNQNSLKNYKKQIKLEELLNSHHMSDDYWNSFKQTFIDEKKDYFDYLIQKYPGLTESNLKLILLQKVGLNNEEIANILGIKIDAVKKSKQRISKKYNVRFDQLLIEKNN